jgi:hypothetical protein
MSAVPPAEPEESEQEHSFFGEDCEACRANAAPHDA